MNSKRIGGREVRTNWATSKRAPPPTQNDPEAVARASSEYNTTVYVGGLQRNPHNGQILKNAFGVFGAIEGKLLFGKFLQMYKIVDFFWTLSMNFFVCLIFFGRLVFLLNFFLWWTFFFFELFLFFELFSFLIFFFFELFSLLNLFLFLNFFLWWTFLFLNFFIFCFEVFLNFFFWTFFRTFCLLALSSTFFLNYFLNFFSNFFGLFYEQFCELFLELYFKILPVF